ncbi:MAG: hypothetical protein Q9169_001294 [Polycauliona sp. 2 TL-2023]
MRLCLSRPSANAAFTLLTYLDCLSISPFPIKAADADAPVQEDHNHHRLLNLLDQSNAFQDEQIGETAYEPDFPALDRGIIGRAPPAVTALANNAPQPMNIEPGDIQHWTFPKSGLQAPYASPAFDLPLNLSATTNTTCLENDLIQLAKKQTTTANIKNVWLSISVCDQPTSPTAGTAGLPPQLEVYLSRSANNQQPDGRRHDQVVTVQGGYGYVNLSSVSDDVWIGVRAPKAPDGFKGIYNYELAASIDALYTTYFHGDPQFNDTQITAWDTDSNSSILSTGDITNSLDNATILDWMRRKPPFSVYVHDQADLSIQSLNRSICGLRNHAMVKKSEKSMVDIGGQPKQLFYVNELNSSTSYHAIMTLEEGAGNSTAGGGGTIWKATSFTTKSDNNCQIIYNLPFCTDVAYAVPSNPNRKPNRTELGLLYDTWAKESYENFDKSLQQIPCDTTDSAKYSLARGCQDCDNAYRAWLCAVTIPRCVDFSTSSNDERHLLPRNINQAFINGSEHPTETLGNLFSPENKTSTYLGVSRNARIDREIQPGPYKEMLPCKDLCYHLTQNCPAALRFSCPLESRGLNLSYGHHRREDTEWHCNWPGGPNLYNGAELLSVGWWMIGVMAAVAMYVS